MKMVQTFPLSGTVFQEVTQEKGSNFCRMQDGKKCGIVCPFAAVTRGSNATSLHLPTVLLRFTQTRRKMQQPFHQFKEEKTLSFMSRNSRC